MNEGYRRWEDVKADLDLWYDPSHVFLQSVSRSSTEAFDLILALLREKG